MSTRPYLRPTARQQRDLSRQRRRSAQDEAPRATWHTASTNLDPDETS